MYSKMAGNISADSYGACVQELQPFLKLRYLFLLITNILMQYLHNGNHLKECHLWLILKGISQNMAFHLFSRSNTFLGTVKRIDMQKIWLVSFKPLNKKD